MNKFTMDVVGFDRRKFCARWWSSRSGRQLVNGQIAAPFFSSFCFCFCRAAMDVSIHDGVAGWHSPARALGLPCAHGQCQLCAAVRVDNPVLCREPGLLPRPAGTGTRAGHHGVSCANDSFCP